MPASMAHNMGVTNHLLSRMILQVLYSPFRRKGLIIAGLIELRYVIRWLINPYITRPAISWGGRGCTLGAYQTVRFGRGTCRLKPCVMHEKPGRKTCARGCLGEVSIPPMGRSVLFTYMDGWCIMVNVGKYTSPMDGMGKEKKHN